MQLEPWEDAFLVVDVTAWHLLSYYARLERVQANRALGLVRPQQSLRDLDVHKGLHGILGCWRSAIPVGIVLGQLLDQLLQPRANEIVANVAREGSPSAMSTGESTEGKGLQKAPEDGDRAVRRTVEFGGRILDRGTGADSGEVDEGGEKRRYGGEGVRIVEGETQVGVGIGIRIVARVRVRVRIGVREVELFDEVAVTMGAGEAGAIGGGRGEGPAALVAEVALLGGSAGGCRGGHGRFAETHGQLPPECSLNPSSTDQVRYLLPCHARSAPNWPMAFARSVGPKPRTSTVAMDGVCRTLAAPCQFLGKTLDENPRTTLLCDKSTIALKKYSCSNLLYNFN